MTDQEIRCAILKYVYDEKKAGKEVARGIMDRVARDYGVAPQRVDSILLDLKKGGLVKNAPRATMANATDMVITDKGISEYEEKCSETKGD